MRRGDANGWLVELGDRARKRVRSVRMGRLDRENERLRAETAVLRDVLEKERVALADVMSSIHEGSASKRRVRPMRTIVIAGGAYLLGTWAGRERYQQILGAFRGAVEDIRQRWRWSPAWESAGLPDAGVPVVPDEPSVVR